MQQDGPPNWCKLLWQPRAGGASSEPPGAKSLILQRPKDSCCSRRGSEADVPKHLDRSGARRSSVRRPSAGPLYPTWACCVRGASALRTRLFVSACRFELLELCTKAAKYRAPEKTCPSENRTPL